MRLPEHLSQLLSEAEIRFFGEVAIWHCPDSKEYRACHRNDDTNLLSDLTELVSVPDVREMTKYCAERKYRPLKTSPNLKTGWFIADSDLDAFYEKFDAIYPGAFAGTVRYLEGSFEPVPLRETLGRQTGMYRFSSNITDNHANQIMRETCAKGCLRKIAWPIDDQCPVSQFHITGRSIPVVCTEACTFVVTEARRLAREAYDKTNP